MQTRLSWVQFLKAFKDAFHAHPISPGEYGNSFGWTERMLSVPDGVIPRMQPFLSVDLPLEFKSQWYTVDGLFVSPNPPDVIPGHVHCIVEHENGERWHEEIWKLAHWRCPLKVLISYDYNEDRKTGKRGDWIGNAISQGRGQLRRINAVQHDDPATYLLIIGSKATDADPSVRWRALRLNVEDDILRDIDDILANTT